MPQLCPAPGVRVRLLPSPADICRHPSRIAQPSSLSAAAGSSRAQPHATPTSSTTGGTLTSSSTSATTLSPSRPCAGPTRHTGTASPCWVRAGPAAGLVAAGLVPGEPQAHGGFAGVHGRRCSRRFPRHVHHGVDGRGEAVRGIPGRRGGGIPRREQAAGPHRPALLLRRLAGQRGEHAEREPLSRPACLPASSPALTLLLHGAPRLPCADLSLLSPARRQRWGTCPPSCGT